MLLTKHQSSAVVCAIPYNCNDDRMLKKRFVLDIQW